MIKLLNFLFGWDYVYWQNSADQGIAKVHKSKDGYAYFYRYKLTGLIDRVSDYKNGTLIFLTCESNKYH